jgi:hypothetical protein
MGTKSGLQKMGRSDGTDSRFHHSVRFFGDPKRAPRDGPQYSGGFDSTDTHGLRGHCSKMRERRMMAIARACPFFCDAAAQTSARASGSVYTGHAPSIHQRVTTTLCTRHCCAMTAHSPQLPGDSASQAKRMHRVLQHARCRLSMRRKQTQGRSPPQP